jgi:hypothetical protein
VRVGEVYLGILILAESLASWAFYLTTGMTVGSLLLYGLGIQQVVQIFMTTNEAGYIGGDQFSSAQTGVFLLESLELLIGPIVAAALLWDGLTSRQEFH